MRVITIDNSLYRGLSDDGIFLLWAEINDEGNVTREIGFDLQRRVAHLYPGVGSLGDYGVLDLAKFELRDQKGEIAPEMFERAWSAGFGWKLPD